jgi:hypothetical protein
VIPTTVPDILRSVLHRWQRRRPDLPPARRVVDNVLTLPAMNADIVRDHMLQCKEISVCMGASNNNARASGANLSATIFFDREYLFF